MFNKGLSVHYADVVTFIQEQWGCNDPYCSVDFSIKVWNELADQAVRDKVGNGICPLPFCVRLVGQSGSGKTSQLLPAVCEALEACSISYVRLAVRDFVAYHPFLEEIRKIYGEALLREKTNAFALTLLTFVFEKLVQQHFPILFEVTLLSPIYEAFIHQCLQRYNYLCDYQCLAVSKALSDQWIAKRCASTGRVVLEKSSHFFFETLRPALESLKSIQLHNRLLLWDCRNALPLITSLQSETLWEDWQERLEFSVSLDPKLLSKYKLTFLKNFYQNTDFEKLKI